MKNLTISVRSTKSFLHTTGNFNFSKSKNNRLGKHFQRDFLASYKLFNLFAMTVGHRNG